MENEDFTLHPFPKNNSHNEARLISHHRLGAFPIFFAILPLRGPPPSSMMTIMIYIVRPKLPEPPSSADVPPRDLGFRSCWEREGERQERRGALLILHSSPEFNDSLVRYWAASCMQQTESSRSWGSHRKIKHERQCFPAVACLHCHVSC